MVRVTVRDVDAMHGVARVDVPKIPSAWPHEIIVPLSDLELPPLVADDPRVVELVAATRDLIDAAWGNIDTARGRVRRALAALEERK